MHILEKLVKASGNPYGIQGSKINDVNNYIDTGSYSFNALISGSIYGGIPDNKIIALAGESAVGKTFFALSIAKNFLNSNSNANVIYFDAESAITTDVIKTHNIDSKRFAILGIDTIENFRTQCIKILNDYETNSEDVREQNPIMIVLDSLGMMATNKETEDIGEGKNVRDMTKASVIKGAFRVLTLKLSKLKVPLILTNHMYANVSPYGPRTEMGGGSGVKYAASIIVELTKKKITDSDKTVIGNNIICKLLKSRITQEQKTSETKLYFDARGLDKYHGLLELGLKHNVFKKNGAWYSYNDMKFQTTKIENETFWTPELLEVMNKCAEAEYKYGREKFE